MVQKGLKSVCPKLNIQKRLVKNSQRLKYLQTERCLLVSQHLLHLHAPLLQSLQPSCSGSRHLLNRMMKYANMQIHREQRREMHWHIKEWHIKVVRTFCFNSKSVFHSRVWGLPLICQSSWFWSALGCWDGAEDQKGAWGVWCL